VNVSAEEITVRVQHRGAQVVVGAFKDFASGDWLRRVRILWDHSPPQTLRVCLSVGGSKAGPGLDPRPRMYRNRSRIASVLGQGSFRNTGPVNRTSRTRIAECRSTF
jgi:hypothetical protein